MKIERAPKSFLINNISGISQSAAIVFLGGELKNEAYARELASISKLIVCADSGAEHARKLGLTPDAIIGDLDSVTPGTIKYFEDKNCEIIRILDQESNDFEKALDYILEKSEIDESANGVFVFGMTGGRIDHTLTNFSIMLRYADRFDCIVAFELGAEHRFLTTANNNCKIECEIGTTISLTPFGEANGIVTKNLQYRLSSDTLRLGIREGLSNISTGLPVTITMKSGALLVTIVNHILEKIM